MSVSVNLCTPAYLLNNTRANAYIQLVWADVLEVTSMFEEDEEWEDDEEEDEEDW